MRKTKTPKPKTHHARPGDTIKIHSDHKGTEKGPIHPGVSDGGPSKVKAAMPKSKKKPKSGGMGGMKMKGMRGMPGTL